MNRVTRGCLVGTGFCFISHLGQVQGCGYLDRPAGNIREQSFSHIWWYSPLFQELRNLALLEGKCGVCEFKKVCGGCRARAYESTGNYLAEEPYCVYEPRRGRIASGGVYPEPSAKGPSQ
ncbi:MAG: SPASM domain-containing protein [Dehalococcoidia bacterium]|nr:SPASM domain-containing protein [Dehalococcoidia bacterium]